jgi:phosphotransferase system enzyme I (PtsI)
MRLKGIGASPGIAIGAAFVVNAARHHIVRKHIPENMLEREQQRFRDAVSEVEEQLSRLLDEIPEELRAHSDILKSHLMMLEDPMVYDRTLALIEEQGINAEWGLDNALADVRKLFSKVKDSYIRERLEDIEFVVKKVQLFLAGEDAFIDISEINEPVIIVARDLSPADTVQINKDKILAFVTEVGSRTSHTAILARSLGIPAVVGLDMVTSRVQSGRHVIVDGTTGKMLVSPEEHEISKYLQKQQKYINYRLEIVHHSNLPAETRDGYRIRIKANIEFVDEIPSIIANGAEGIGLFRTEFHYLAKKELPTEDELYSSYRQVLEKVSPYPVTIRTLDIGGDKFLSNINLDEEINPALGLRAIRLCLRERQLFRTQLRAILRAALHGNPRIMFPLVSGIQEVLEVKKFLAEVVSGLESEGTKFKKDVPVGIMIEVPTAVLMSDVLARHVDFFSIGTNDLIQYSLAIDRVNESVAHLYEPLHPGVLRMIKTSVESAHGCGIPAAMCGEMAGVPMYIPILIGMGLDELSMSAQDIPKAKRIIRNSNQEQCEELVRNLQNIYSSDEMRDVVVRFFKENYTADFWSEEYGYMN